MANEEQNVKFVDVVKAFLGVGAKPTTQAGDEEKRSTEYIPKEGLGSGWYRLLKKWYLDIMTYSGSRLDKYDRFDFLDMNLSEASASLNIYADNIVSGAIGGAENFKVMIDENTPGIDVIQNVIEETEKRTRIKDYIWDISRDMTKSGDDFEEVVVVEGADKKYWIDKLKKLPEKEIYANVDERGVFTDPDYPYIQRKDEYHKEGIKFDWWRILHFKVGREVYGVDRSLFANASQRIGKQLLWIDDSIVLARMTRAWMRYAFNIDTTGMSPDQAFEYVEKYKEQVKRKEVIDRDTGRMDIADSPPMPDEDIFFPSREGSKQGVSVLTGDLNIGNIKDVEYLQKKFLMALNVPKAYVGLEEGTRAKATLSQIDVQFARQVRRRQNALVPGLRRFYELAFILAGIDPNSFGWSIVFPELNTTDELIRWEMMLIKAEVAKILAVDIGAVNNQWIYVEILGFTDEEIEDYAFVLPDDEDGDFTQITPEMARAIKSNPMIRYLLQDMKELIAYKKQSDTDAENKREIGIKREESLADRWS